MEVPQKNPKNKFWKNVLEKEGPLEGKRLDGTTKCRKTPPNCPVRKTGAKRQDIGMTGGRRQERSWPGNVLKDTVRTKTNPGVHKITTEI